jgi:hypothetical protein
MRKLPDTLDVPKLVGEYGATWKDLVDAGLTDYTARRMARETTPRPLALTEAVQVQPPPSTHDIVALVPMGDLGRRYLTLDVYLRAATLRQQVRIGATYLGWSDQGKIKVVRRITRRWRIGSAAAIASTTINNGAAILAQADVHHEWPGEAVLLELGASVPVELDLGFGRNPTGGSSALFGVRHVELAELHATKKAGGELIDVPTV